MASISDLYQNLFGKNHIQDGDVISMAEHQRVGGVSTGQGYKAVGILNASGSLVSDFGGTVSVSLASLSVSVDFSSFPSISGRVLADQGSAGTTAWLMTLATLSVVTQPGAGALATVTAHQGLAGATPWLVTQATLPVSFAPPSVAGGSLTSYQGTSPWVVSGAVTNANLDVTLGSRLASGSTLPITGNVGQLGTWTVQPGNTPNTTAWLVTMGTLPVAASFSGSIPVAGGSLTAYQGTSPWLVTAATLPVVANINNSSIPVTQSGLWSVGASISNALSIQSMPTLSVFGAGGSLSSFQGGLWNVLASVSGTPMVLNAGGSLSAYAAGGSLSVAQLGAYNVTATISNNVNTLNAGGSLSAFQGGLWNVLASISGIPSVLAAGGSLTAFKNNSSSAMTTMVSASATAVILLAANSARKGASFYNNSSAVLYLRNGSGASTSAFKIAMAASSYFEEPADYSGTVSGTWASATGSVAVTEEY